MKFEEKRSTKKYMELSPVLKEIKKKFKNLMVNGIKGVAASEQDPTQLSFLPVRRN